jgi:hypothetical protein
VVDLPTDLVFDGSWPARVANADGLTGGPGRGSGSGALRLARADATGEPPADLFGSAQLPPGERAGPGDEGPRAVISWGLGLK